jgi:uncharacterized protein
MLRFLIPKEYGFFSVFDEHAATLVDASQGFVEMLENYAEAPVRANNIQTIEHRADDIVHRAMEMLHKTFITPIDRDLIQKLISRMDDVVDLIDGTSSRMVLYGVREPRPDVVDLARVLNRATLEVQKAVKCLPDLKNVEEIKRACIEINKLENDGDSLRDLSVARLFQGDQPTKEILIWKELYETLEWAIDRCEDVADVIWSIVLENA